MKQEAKKFACRNCGHPYEALPPDDVHVVARLERCEDADSIEQAYECENCNHRNIMHWDFKNHFRIAGI